MRCRVRTRSFRRRRSQRSPSGYDKAYPGRPKPNLTPSTLASTGPSNRSSHRLRPSSLRPTSPRSASPSIASVLAKLKEAGLDFNPQASREVIIRRLTLALAGYQPTAAEIAAFVADRDPQATEKLVDRLLASPAFGERWGRHWLDVARYADTKGYVFQEERRYPYAYTYRDWVVKAFNDDLPYDQFLRLQIAADQIVKDPENNRDLRCPGLPDARPPLPQQRARHHRRPHRRRHARHPGPDNGLLALPRPQVRPACRRRNTIPSTPSSIPAKNPRTCRR